MIKFPYGMFDFKSIITEGYFYCDRTSKIPLLENARSQLFIRPRRFGKSLLLSMLENYYDIAKKDHFDGIFGRLEIGKNPTPFRNSYYILKWDFSCIDTTGTVDDIKQSLFNHINSKIKGFVLHYKYNGIDLPEVEIDRNDALYSLDSLLNSVRSTYRAVYLLIDEYDNFANKVMMGVHKDISRYEALVHDEGILRTLFNFVKSNTTSTGFDRTFITGVSPVVMSDITSGYNIAEDIYFHNKLNDICGFKEHEVRNVLKSIVKECGLDIERAEEATAIMKTYYNGYCFVPRLDEYVYNPTLSLYFFKQFQETCLFPFKMLDANLATDESKLEYISRIPSGNELLIYLTEINNEVAVENLSDRFGINEMLDSESKDTRFILSFLYYFGVLTLCGETEMGELALKVPNLVIHGLYVNRVQRMLLPEPRERDLGKMAAREVYQRGNIESLCDFVENRYFSVFKNRDYRWANELTLKTAFLTLLYNDTLYIMDSESELNRGYADLTMIIRPDKRRFKISDVLIEFKFVTLQDVKMTGEEAKNLSKNVLYQLPSIKSALEAGQRQVLEYGRKLDEKYGNLRLKKFVVVALGFERVCFTKVSTTPPTRDGVSCTRVL
ncbi:MAG: AAA family ATPase [Desulfamplus sp.]|nr:AAA family ATPase [Desulfamplus sp.]